MSTRTFNILFNAKHHFELRDTSPEIYCHSRSLQKLIKDAVKVGVEDVVYAAIAGTFQKKKRAAAEQGEQKHKICHFT